MTHVCQGCRAPQSPAWTREHTCSEACHEAWLTRLEAEFGKYKRVTSLETGKTHLVPTRVIMEVGLTGADLHKYPEAES